MADTIDALLRDADALAEVADDLSVAFARDLSAILRRLERGLRPLLVEALTTRQRTRLIEAARQLVLRAEIRALLTKAGYDDFVAVAATRGLNGLARQVIATRVGKQTVEFSAGIAKRIEGLQAMIGVDLLDEGEQVARALWKATLRGVIGQQDPETILDDLVKTLDTKSEPQIRTLYDTSISIYSRQIEALQAAKDPEDTPYLYSGPVDGKVRPFCKEHVGKVYTRAEIDKLDNGQLPNVFLTGGGYNCRHTFHAVSRFGEAAALVNTGERLPEMEAALKRVRVEMKAA